MNALLAFPGLSEAKLDFAYDMRFHVGFRSSTRNQRYECHLGIPRLQV